MLTNAFLQKEHGADTTTAQYGVVAKGVET